MIFAPKLIQLEVVASSSKFEDAVGDSVDACRGFTYQHDAPVFWFVTGLCLRCLRLHEVIVT